MVAGTDLSGVYLGYQAFNILKIPKPKSVALQSEFQKTFCVKRRVTERDRSGYNVSYEHEPCYELVQEGDQQFYMLGYGFEDSLTDLFSRHNSKLVIENVCPADLRTALRLMPDLNAVANTSWRDNQRLIIDDILTHTTGQYVASTGAGKSYTIQKICKVFPRARILISTYSATVLSQLYEDVTADGDIDAGIYSSQAKDPAGRVLFCSLGCLHKFSDRLWDIFILDEKHECATLERTQQLLQIKSRCSYAFSANHNQRKDQADFWLNATFGENRVQVPYKEVVADGDIVPVEIQWENVKGNQAIAKLDARHPAFERLAYWANDSRNLQIAELVEKYKQGHQVLVYVQTVEHAYKLRMLLDCPVAHAKLGHERWQELKLQGLVKHDESNPSKKDLDLLRKRFASGDIRLAICNSVWKRGINFPQLEYLIRADSSSSEHDATQITGRVNRKCPAIGKTKGVVIALKDSFNDAALRRSFNNKKNYDKIGYKQIGWR